MSLNVVIYFGKIKMCVIIDEVCMYKILYVGRPIESVVQVLKESASLDLLGYILDKNLPEDKINNDKKIFRSYDLHEYNFADIDVVKPDLVLVPNYRSLIKSSLIDRYTFVNIHSGILPKWRGFNSNLWALLNGEKKVGYTVHRIRPGMDNGEIYRTIDVDVQDDVKFIDLRKNIIDKLCNQLESILIGIIDGTLQPVEQKENDIVYNCKLNPDDGIVWDWDKPSRYFIGLWQIFSYPPYGTGMKVFIHDKLYYVTKITQETEIAVSMGIPGAVVNMYEDGSVLIKTQDTAVRIYELLDMEMKRMLPCKLLKIGQRLQGNVKTR